MTVLVMSRNLVRIDADAWTVNDHDRLLLTKGGNDVCTFRTWDWVGKEDNATIVKEERS